MKPNLWIILFYTLAAGIFAALTSPIPGTSLLLTGLEILMVVHLAKRNHFDLSLKTLFQQIENAKAGLFDLAKRVLQPLAPPAYPLEALSRQH